jgi:hypothetical protein
MRAFAGLVVWLIPLVLLNGCGSAGRSDWNRGPYTSASPEFRRDAYECERDALGLSPVPVPADAATDRVTDSRGGTYTVRPSGLRAGIQSAGASMGAGIQRKRIFESCLQTRGWAMGGAGPTNQVASATGPAPRQSDLTGPAAITRAKAERYRELDQLQAQAAPTPSSPRPEAAPPRAEPWFHGTSGPVAWEVVAIEQNRTADGRMIRWDFQLVLRERAGVGISFQTLVADSEGPATRTSADRRTFARRLEARAELRYTSSYWITLSPERAAGFGVIPGGREGVRLLRRFEGRDDGGHSIRVDVRFTLDPSVGDRPQVAADVTPLPSLRPVKPDEVQVLAGRWKGLLRDERGITFAFTLTVHPDGQFDAAAGTTVVQEFRGTLVPFQSGVLQYTTGSQSGRASVHGEGSDRVLAASAAPNPGAGASAVPYSFRVRFAEATPAIMAPVVSSGPSSAPAVQFLAPISGADEVLTNESILSMVRAGLDETVILAKITATPTRFDTRTEALIELKRAGVPDRVLAAMVGKK